MQGLGQTLFERLQGKFGGGVSAMLTMQYRMNTAIMQWPSHQLYQDLLTAHPSVASHTLQDLPVGMTPLGTKWPNHAYERPLC